MKFHSFIYYTKLAISDEDNNFVANFLEKSCEIIESEINEKSNNKYQFKIDFLYLEKGEKGVNDIINKMNSYKDFFITHGHVISKHNETIIDKNLNKKYFIFNTSQSIEKKILDNPNVFVTGRTDNSVRIDYIQDEINLIKNNKIFFLHNEVRLCNKIIDKNKHNSNFKDYSFKDKEVDEIKSNILKIFDELNNKDLIILDVGLKCFKEVFLFLEDNNFTNRVINNFGSLDTRFKKLSFDIIDLSGQHLVPSLSLRDMINKVFGYEISSNKMSLLLDSAYRLEYPLLFSQALDKCDDVDIENQDIDKIRSKILSFNGSTDIFVGKRLQYAFNENRSNILKDNFIYIYPNSLQLRDNDTPKILYHTQYVKEDNKTIKKKLLYAYIDILRVTNIEIKEGFWTAEFYIDIISVFENPIEEIIFNNLSTLNEKFTFKEIWTRTEENNFKTKRYYVVANYDFIAVADNYPFDWQNIYIAMTIKNKDESILQPIPLNLLDTEFEIGGWSIQDSFSGIKYQKNRLYQDTDLKRTVSISSENRIGWILKRKNTATLFKIGIPMSFLIFLVYYSVFLNYNDASNGVGILTTTFLSAIALYFSVEKPEPKRMTIVDLLFMWFYFVNGITVMTIGIISFLNEETFNLLTLILKIIIPLSLVSIAILLWKRIKQSRNDILLDRDI